MMILYESELIVFSKLALSGGGTIVPPCNYQSIWGDIFNMNRLLKLSGTAAFAAVTLGTASNAAAICPVSHEDLTMALKASVGAVEGGPSNGGFDLHMWASVVDRTGKVCAVTFSGEENDDQWPGSRVISAQKAYTANAFSLDGLALSTANLFTAVQPGNSLFGLQFSNPVDPTEAYDDPASNFGRPNDPMTGERVGGVNVFGGGLALYDATGVIGALGVSGDSSCADHNIAWRVRVALGLDDVPGGVQPNNGDDGIIYSSTNVGNGFAHPECGGGELGVAIEIGAGS